MKNNDNPSTLGEKIKALRNEKGLTQKELCADFMTRNMLSLIENDSAFPSGKTIKYLSEKLGVSAGFFFDETNDPFVYKKILVIDEIRRLFKNKDYQACKKQCSLLPAYDDETAYIASLCNFYEGYEHFKNGKYASCKKSFDESLSLAQKTVYDTENVRSRIKTLSYLANLATSNQARPDFPLPKTSEYTNDLEYDFYVYMLKATELFRYDLAAQIYDSFKFTNEYYKLHISARLSMASFNNERAVRLLSEIVDSFDETNPDVSFRMSVLSDLENASKSISNYEKAYNCMIMKSKLAEKFDK